MPPTKPLILIVFPSDLAKEALLKKNPVLNVESLITDSWWISDLSEIRNLDKAKLSDVQIYYGGVNFLYLLLPLLPQLKWVQLPEAGVDVLLRENLKIPNDLIITRNGGTCRVSISQFVIGRIIAATFNFDLHSENQRAVHWSDEVSSKPLSSCTVAILGLGIIGTEIARSCKYLGMTVWALTRSKVTDKERLIHVDEVRQVRELSEVLSHCEFLVNVLPSTPATRSLLAGDTLANCAKKQPVFINVGRGDIISDESLIKALRSRWISRAVLDVFSTEPLPTSSPLWRERGVVITPHVAHGISADSTYSKLADMFLDNYTSFTRGQSLKYVVNMDRGY